MKKNYKTTLAAALLITPIEKIIQKNILTKFMMAFKEISSYADIKARYTLQENERKIEYLHKKDECLRNMYHIINEAAIKNIFYGFTMLKELEMRGLQKKTAVLSLGQVMKSNITQKKKESLNKIKNYLKKLHLFCMLMQNLLKNILHHSVQKIKHNSKYRLKRSNTISKKIKDVIKNLKNQELKIFLLKWKKQADLIKGLMIRKKYCNQIGVKSIALILGYAYSRTLRYTYDKINSIKKVKNSLKAMQLLGNIIQAFIKKRKNSQFLFIRNLYRAEKSIQKMFKTLKKVRKLHLRHNFRKIERFTVSLYKTKVLKFFMTIQSVIQKIKSKNLRSAWISFLRIPYPDNEFDPCPNFSYYSPKIDKQKLGILRSKHYGSIAASEDCQTSNSNFKFEQETNRLKKLKSVTQSLSVINTPRLIMSSINSSKESLLRKDSLELQGFKKTLIQKKISEASLKIKPTKNPNGKPPLKPPWKPASASVVQSNKKIPINSAVRRSQYAVALKERVKSHSKTISADISNYAMTPNGSSRNSSRQKHTRVSFVNLDNVFSNLRFAVVILENVTNTVLTKRMFESLCKIKYAHKYSPKLPAPNPLDPQPRVTTKPSWQNNLFKIGFEKLKHLAKCAIGREIIKRIKT